MKKIAVIGGEGFVGRNIKVSKKEYYLYSIDIQRHSDEGYSYNEYFRADICTDEGQAIIRKISPEIVIILAGRQFLSPVQKRNQRISSFDLNTRIAESVVRICNEVASVKKVVFVSTDMVYGKPGLALISEEISPKPIGPYGESKLKAESILISLKCEVIVLRPRLIIGPGRTGTVALLAKFIKLGLPIPIIGNGENRYQMISVFDLWSGIEMLIERGSHGVYNIGSDSPPTLNNLLPSALSSLKKKNKLIRFPKRITEIALRTLDWIGISPLAPEQFEIASLNCILDTTKIKSLGWTPKYSDEEMLSENLSKLL